MYFALKRHPDVFLSTPKEPNFFASDLCSGVNQGTFIQLTEPDYLSLFDAANNSRIVGEASACYLYSEVAAQRIAKFEPGAKILMILREPVSFLYSYYTQLLKNPASENETARTFERALELESERKRGAALPPGCQVPQLLFYRERVRYADHIERYLARFPREQVLILLYDDFLQSNEATYRRVLDFLELDAYPLGDIGRHNQSRLVRSGALRRVVDDMSAGAGGFSALQRLVKRITPRGPRRRLQSWVYEHFVFKPVPELSPETSARLKREIAPEVTKLENLLGIDLLRRWGYDREDPVPVTQQAPS